MFFEGTAWVLVYPKVCKCCDVGVNYQCIYERNKN